MSRYAPARAILAVPVDQLSAIPAEIVVALRASHVRTAAVFLDALGALRTLLCDFLDRSEACVFLFDLILDARLILFAGFVLVPWAVAGDAGSVATVCADEDVGLESRWRDCLGFSRVSGFLRTACGTDAIHDPACQ